MKLLNFVIDLPLFVNDLVIFENLMRNFGADLLFLVSATGQIYFQIE